MSCRQVPCRYCGKIILTPDPVEISTYVKCFDCAEKFYDEVKHSKHIPTRSIPYSGKVEKLITYQDNWAPPFGMNSVENQLWQRIMQLKNKIEADL